MVEVRIPFRNCIKNLLIFASVTATFFVLGWIHPEIMAKAKKGPLTWPYALEAVKFFFTPLLTWMTFEYSFFLSDNLLFKATEQGILRHYPLDGYLSHRWPDIKSIGVQQLDTKFEMLIFVVKPGREKKLYFGLLKARKIVVPTATSGVSARALLAQIEKIQDAKEFFKKPAA